MMQCIFDIFKIAVEQSCFFDVYALKEIGMETGNIFRRLNNMTHWLQIGDVYDRI